MTIEERVRQLEDLEAIRDVFQSYRSLLDGRDLVGYSQLFTDDAEWHGASMRASGGPGGILAMLQERYTQGEMADDRHLAVNPVIEIDGDEARATSTIVVVGRTADGPPELRVLGEYVDDLRRCEDGRWRFARRLAGIAIPPLGLFES